LRIATVGTRPDPIISILATTSTALASRDYAALATSVHTDLRTMNLAILGPHRLLTRVSIFICLKILTLEGLARERLSLDNLSLAPVSFIRSAAPTPNSLAT